ncbi:gamma-glutamyltransferase [Salipaludibacillus aurantiacus]|uniref:Glutathione hydrolase proenzyme n=1 Tax=Salipaludibacillus aurantiacus TaxID=1601833 RepID=A0A1H9W2C7_9BACI|nr:gamma-glutamyltransferase [Salipaludibacillus aurantiacus]SES27944.1 gamma-glutamyltranspeptidase / glutathione hydrolase [Salipaludibacillus aurantiacus]
MNFTSAQTYPYSSMRNAAFAKNGMVATSQPLAVQAGIETMKKGGNAIDGAVATAACLTVVEPTSNGIGSDAFALVWTKDHLHGLNASGYAPETLTREKVLDLGFEEMPKYGAVPITVPGAPKAWAELIKQFGKLSLSEVLEPAVRYAREGFAVTPTLARFWEKAYNEYQILEPKSVFEEWFKVFAPEGKAPEAGDLWGSPDHAKTLEEIGRTNAESFYRGDLASRIANTVQSHGGFLSREDLAAFEPEWVDPISVNYRGYDIWEIPPNGQGIISLMALNIMKGFPFSERDIGTVEAYHKQIEAMKMSFSDGLHYVTQEDEMKVSVKELLAEKYADERRSVISDQAKEPKHGNPKKGGTVYLATADQEGNMVSFIQSNYMGFGSGVVIPGTGISMQNRGNNFSLREQDANVLKPRKKTYHTIIPGFVTKNAQAVGPFGVMGGFMQPQGHLQVIMNSIDYKLNPQSALDAPRWLWEGGKTVKVDPTFPVDLSYELERRGHEIIRMNNHDEFGRGQIIWRDSETGLLIGGTDPRTDGVAGIY